MKSFPKLSSNSNYYNELCNNKATIVITNS